MFSNFKVCNSNNSNSPTNQLAIGTEKNQTSEIQKSDIQKFIPIQW